MKKIISFMLVFFLAVSLLAGCGGKKDDENQEKQEQGSSEDNQKLEGSLLASEPKTFSIFLNFNNMPFNKDWKVWKVIGDKTNIYLDGILSQSSSNEEEAFSLMLSSGQLADVVGYSDPAELEKLGRDGGLLALNDLIDQHAPDLKNALDEDPRFKQFATSLDGNIYFIPKQSKLFSAEYYWIRQDWLDKLGLEVPETVEDLYKVLTAFKNEDPNGNGQKDEVPLFDRAGYKMPDEYLYLFDTSTEFYPRDGKMTFEPLEENFVYGVKELAKWYKEGLIDPEILTRGSKSRDVLYGANQGGFTHDWPSTANYNDSLAESIPGFKNVAIPPLKNQNGEIIERIQRSPVAGWGISSQCKDPVTLIKYFNYFFTEEGSNLVNWGIEGETYTVDADGNKAYTDAVMGNPDMNPLSYLRTLGVQYRIGMIQDPAYEFAFMSGEAKNAAELYNSNEDWFPKDLPPYFDGELNLKYLPEDEAEYKRIMSSIRPYVDKMFEEWLLGTNKIEDNYEQFVNELKTRNIDRAIEINQKAYETYLGK